MSDTDAFLSFSPAPWLVLIVSGLLVIAWFYRAANRPISDTDRRLAAIDEDLDRKERAFRAHQRAKSNVTVGPWPPREARPLRENQARHNCRPHTAGVGLVTPLDPPVAPTDGGPHGEFHVNYSSYLRGLHAATYGPPPEDDDAA